MLEELLNIERFGVNDINKNIDINIVKNKLMNNKELWICLYNEQNRGEKYYNEQLVKIVNKMTCYNKLQKFLC